MKIEQDEIIGKKDKKSGSKVTKIILILIVFIVLISIGIIVLLNYINGERLVLTIDGQRVTNTSDLFWFSETTGEVYVSIKDIAPLVGYEWHNGEYKINTEDISKMYVEAKDGTETTSFYLNSTLISKIPPDSTAEYENIELNAPVTIMDGKWYINAEGFMQSFNSIFSYNKKENTITIQTLPYLVSYYEANISQFGYDYISDNFNNQKAIIYGMIVASKNSTGKYGVISSRNGEEIISPRYNDIEFIENAREFIITNASNKVGIAYSTGETKIDVKYDEIAVLDSTLGYYVVSSNSKYGVLNSKQELIIHIEYDGIGIDTSEFPADNVKSQYVLYDSIIPVYLNGKWGLFDVNGKKVTEVEYDTIGCINNDITDKAVNNSIIIGDSEVIVVSKDGLYGGVSTKGDILLTLMFEYVYSITSGGETNYYMVYQGVDYNALDYIERMKERLGYNKEEQNEKEDKTNQSNNSNEQNNNEQNNVNEINNNNEQNNVNVSNSQENNQLGDINTSTNGENNNTSTEENNNQNESNNENNISIEVSMYNAMFEPYEGEHSRGSIRSLIDSIHNTNLTHENKIQVEYNENIYLENVTSLKQELNNNAYIITIEHNQETGYVSKIIIK